MKNKQNKNIVTWNKALKHFDRNRIKQMRIDLGFDKYGLRSVKEFEDWQKNVRYFLDDENLTDEEIENTIAYKSILMRHEISSMSPYTKKGFENAIRQYLFFDEVSEESILSANSTGCSLELVINDDFKMEKGLYIRIGDSSTITDIKEFIKKNHLEIRDDLVRFRKRMGIKKIPNPKSEDFNKNEIVHNLNTSPIDFLRKMSIKMGIYEERSTPKRRDILSTAIMKKMGYDIQPENFKVIAQREKVEREKYKK